jgi:prevent-host-death family protein
MPCFQWLRLWFVIKQTKRLTIKRPKCTFESSHYVYRGVRKEKKMPPATALNAATTVEARNSFSELVNRAAYGKERVVLKRRGKAVAAVVPIDDVDLLRLLEDEIDIRDALIARREAKQKGSVSLEDLRRRLGV